MIHKVESIAWVVCMSLCARLHQKYTYHITPTSAAALIKFFAPQMRCLFEGASYLRAALIQKLDAAKKKNAENRLLALTNFFVANAALIRGRRLFGGGAYSSKYGKSLKNMTLVWTKHAMHMIIHIFEFDNLHHWYDRKQEIYNIKVQ